MATKQEKINIDKNTNLNIFESNNPYALEERNI